MAPDASLLARLSRLASEVAVDADALEARAAEAGELLDRWKADGSLPRAERIVVAVSPHGWYTALETLLERVARLLDETVPSGPSWHVELVRQMQVEVPGVRPAVVPGAAAEELHELRKFRHFFRNAYVLELDAARVEAHAERLRRVHPRVARQLAAFRAHLDAVIAELAAS